MAPEVSGEEVPHWRAEARGHRDDAREAYAPSMKDRPELDVSKLYRRALRRMPETTDGQPPLPVPEACPVTLDEWAPSASRNCRMRKLMEILAPRKRRAADDRQS
jgi:hypothetical protein